MPWPRHSFLLQASMTISRYKNFVSTSELSDGLFKSGSLTLKSVVKSTFLPYCLPRRSMDVYPARKFLTCRWKSCSTGNAKPADKIKIIASSMCMSILMLLSERTTFEAKKHRSAKCSFEVPHVLTILYSRYSCQSS